MRSQDDLSGHLPPKPGIETGLPRPPRAPVDPGSGSGTGEKNERFRPSPPPNQGPVLEWYKGSRRRSIMAGLGGIVVVAAGLTLKDGGSLEWTSIWWMWLFPLAAGPLIALSTRVAGCSAGAEWFAVGKNWVRTYELTSVKLKTPANYRELRLEDSDGRTLSIKLLTAQENRDLWDLVYNGILHSVVNGEAETNALAHRAFKLPEPRMK